MSDVTLEGLARSINLRDLGGIAAADGRTVRRGALFRSAALAELSPAERAALAGLGVRAIIDLRYNSERAKHPTPWKELGCSAYWAHDYEPSGGGDLSALLADGRLTSEGAREMMVGAYRELPFQHLETLRRLFGAVAAGEGPLLFHCTSGKDRTGMSAALILSAVGAPREAIVADYLASLNFDVLASPAFRGLMPERRAVLEPIYRVERGYLDAMFEAIEAREGSVDGFLRGTLGLAPAELTALGETLLA
jgi:protein-tyrosine phosphatase